MPGLARKAGGYDDDVRILGFGIAVGSGDGHVVTLYGSRLQHVQTFALRNAVDHVHQNDIGQRFGGYFLCSIGAYVAGSDDGYFSSHLLCETPWLRLNPKYNNANGT